MTLLRRLACRITYHLVTVHYGVARCSRCGRSWTARSYT